MRSIKEECPSRVVPFGERHLRRTIAEYVEHYHRERNHQGLDNEPITGALIERAIEFAGAKDSEGSSITTRARRVDAQHSMCSAHQWDITGFHSGAQMLGSLVLGQDFAVRVIELRDVTLGFVPDQANDGVVIDLVGRPTCGTERAT